MNNYKTPFLDYYNQHNCVPVEQDITDLERHYSRREALYRCLGIPSMALKGKDILELGPGLGHNSIFTNLWQPKSYTFIDGTEIAINETRKRMNKYYSSTENCHYYHQSLDAYEGEESFDFVFCEGVIPGQLEPSDFVRRLSSYVKPSGVLVITCADSISLFSELIRRVIAKQILVRDGVNESNYVEFLKPIFIGQVSNLKGMSSKFDDWIIDKLLMPTVGQLFSIEDAIFSLEKDFEFYSSSPDFVKDWRWYKDIFLSDRKLNENAILSYRKNTLNFLDYRSTFDEIDTNTSMALCRIADEMFELFLLHQNNPNSGVIQNIVSLLEEAYEVVVPLSKMTAKSINTHKSAMVMISNGVNPLDLSDFLECGWFGRGQQYLSFTKNMEY